jgi:DNA-binding transcriptional MerR regulator
MNEAGQDSLFPWENDPNRTEAPESERPGPPPSQTPGASRSATQPAGAQTPAAQEKTQSAPASADAGGAAARRGERPLVKKEYYSISEAADLVGLPAHVLRYWETQFSVLNPSKNRSGNRVYQRKEIRLILLVKQLLYDEKYTVEGAKQKLEQLRRGGTLAENTTRALDTQLVRVLRDDLKAVLRILSPDTE